MWCKNNKYERVWCSKNILLKLIARLQETTSLMKCFYDIIYKTFLCVHIYLYICIYIHIHAFLPYISTENLYSILIWISTEIDREAILRQWFFENTYFLHSDSNSYRHMDNIHNPYNWAWRFYGKPGINKWKPGVFTIYKWHTYTQNIKYFRAYVFSEYSENNKHKLHYRILTMC